MPRRSDGPRPDADGSRTTSRGSRASTKEFLRQLSGAERAQTLLYVHGIGNKPKPDVLKCQWDHALFGVDMGERSRLAYWVNREYYPEPVAASCGDADDVSVDDPTTPRALAALAAGEVEPEEEIDSLTSDPVERKRLRAMARHIVDSPFVDPPGGEEAAGRLGISRTEAKVLFFLPAPVRRRITRRITRAFLRDVHDFMDRRDRRERMRRSMLERMEVGGGPFVVVAHSQGSIIAYDVLRDLDRRGFQVPLFITIGSPLGLQEVQDFLRITDGDGLAVPDCVACWLNVADVLDPVAFDSDLSNDFTPSGAIRNLRRIGLNPHSPRHPHSGSGYLSIDEVRQSVRVAIGTRLPQEVSDFVIARDLVRQIENSESEERHQVLVQLSDASAKASLDEIRTTVVEELERLPDAAGRDPDAELQKARRIDPLQRYVSADLTRSEVERLSRHRSGSAVEIVWRNAPKRALVLESIDTVQCTPAILSYGAAGRGIRWAVLDTGINSDHPHFALHSNIEEQWDCTSPGPPRKAPRRADRNGHGTHVAGIVAGEFALQDGSGKIVRGMAPLTKIVGYKVLDDQGGGRDSYILKALDHIAKLNERAGDDYVHGVNLSLGGPFDPSVFGCGHTPLCRELRRLWRQGVVVVLAAGNEGWERIQGQRGWLDANMDLSIGDPANLEEAIAVGSVHKNRPHTYGVSYFSSRGPTADGRVKPDLVAPGEKIISACHEFSGQDLPSLYVAMSGTSMAAPHVSGMLAAFLSVRREFLGFPDRVKRILIDSCVDLNRDPYIQGHGLPNLIKMLALN